MKTLLISSKKTVANVRGRPVFALAPLLVAFFAFADAALGQCARDLPPFGSIGVGQFECIGGPCSVNLRTGRPYGHSFSTEPRLRQIDPDGPGAGLVHDGDVLVAVDGQLITTVDGGQKLGSLEPGVAVTLTLRRSGTETDVTLIPLESCDFPGLMVRSADHSAYAYGTGALQRGWVSGDSVYFSYGDSIAVGYGAGRRYTLAPTPGGAADWNVAGRRRGVGFTVNDSTGFSYTVTGSLAPPAERERQLARIAAGNARWGSLADMGLLRPPAELGVELRCGDCGFRVRSGSAVFETDVFPVIASIEKGGPADEAGLLVDDVILSVAGRAITAGRTLGALRVGSPVKLEVRRGDRIIEVTVTPRGPSSPRQRW